MDDEVQNGINIGVATTKNLYCMAGLCEGRRTELSHGESM